MIRDILKMPRLTQEQMNQIEADNEAKSVIGQKAIDEKAKQDIIDDAKKKDKKLSESVKPFPRENAFAKNITTFEQFLYKKYTEAE